MTENIVVNGFEIELEIELKEDQGPQRKKERSLDNSELNTNDYNLDNKISKFSDSDKRYNLISTR